MEITTETPIGKFIVDSSTAKIVHILEGGELILNQIIYRAEIQDYQDEKGWVRQGWTASISIDASFMDKIIIDTNLLYPRDKMIFCAITGKRIN